MQTQIPISLTHHLSTKLLSPLFLFHFPLPRKNSNFLSFHHTKWVFTPKSITFCSSTSLESLTYGGWDDPGLGGDPVHSGEFNFLSSLGINDKRYMFVYLLGFVCALAISRVKVSSIIVLPACFVVFAIGFSFGFVNGGHMNELSLIGTKKKPNEDSIRVSVENLRKMVDLFDDFDVKIVNLKNDIRRGITSNIITVGDLENYINAIESIEVSAKNTKTVAEGVINNISSVENQEVERILNDKLSKKKREANGTVSGFFQFVSALFKGNSKSIKAKDLVKREKADIMSNDQIRRNILTPSAEKQIPRFINVDTDNIESEDSFLSTDIFREIDENENISFMGLGSGGKRVFTSKEYSFETNKIRSMDGDLHPLNNGGFNSVETLKYKDDLHGLDVGNNRESITSDAYFDQENTFKKINGNYTSSNNKKNSPSRSVGFDSSPSSVVSDDMMFNGYLTEANTLLKQARNFLNKGGNKGDTEKALRKSARLLSKAIDMKPMSLLAVGQLGNTYLLHGELKLKTSRKLRALLASGNESLLVESDYLIKGLVEEVTSKEKVGSVLVDVCEECEELLVKAGRKYRLALSIDGNDMRALYNWGLALSFRAQLIADIGPEAAYDADKLFLAAIDKFDAMMSKSNVYAPDALFRWGLALQQRSRLRRRNSREKVKLLEQAKSLYEDVLDMDTNNNNHQVRDALLSCLSELNLHGRPYLN